MAADGDRQPCYHICRRVDYRNGIVVEVCNIDRAAVGGLVPPAIRPAEKFLERGRARARRLHSAIRNELNRFVARKQSCLVAKHDFRQA